MRLKTYTAQTTAEAMDLVRGEMGEDAIIVSTQRLDDGNGVRITAALEDLKRDSDPSFQGPEDTKPDIPGSIRQILLSHGTPMGLAERLSRAAGEVQADNATMALAGGVDALFGFHPLSKTGTKRPIMLIGPPGAGKTVTVAKLAARATMDKKDIGVITTDSQRAGAVEQLEAFTKILDIDLKTAATIEDLKNALKELADKSIVYIDTPGTNPFSDKEMEQLAESIKVSGAEPILVLPAGGDALEMAESAQAFSTIGAERLLITRVDMARRLGGILAAADAGRLRFSEISITPSIGDGLSAINPVSLARILIPEDFDLPLEPQADKAAS